MLIHEPLVYVLVVVMIVLSLMVPSEIVGKAQMRQELRQLKENLVLLRSLNFPEQAQSLEKRLIRAEKYLQQALAFGEKKDFEAAGKAFQKVEQELAAVDELEQPLALLQTEIISSEKRCI